MRPCDCRRAARALRAALPHRFHANCHPLLIGSLPLEDHREATELMLRYTPEIPLWVQLPVHAREMMVAQFAPGLPGLRMSGGLPRVDKTEPAYSDDLLSFYEECLAVQQDSRKLDRSRFVLDDHAAKGFGLLLARLQNAARPPLAVKGQVTGPITFGTAVRDETDQAIFFDPQLRDAALKLLALKARWQARRLSALQCPVMIFCDEPALAGYGSSEYIGISREDIMACLGEVIGAVHAEGGLAGVHVCANTDWSLVLESGADIVSFDAYSHFERFALYREQIRRFIDAGNILAWGIVPTGSPENLAAATAESLLAQWHAKVRVLERMGIDRAAVMVQSLVTPSCGTGALTVQQAVKVAQLTRQVSDRLKRNLAEDGEYGSGGTTL